MSCIAYFIQFYFIRVSMNFDFLFRENGDFMEPRQDRVQFTGQYLVQTSIIKMYNNLVSSFGEETYQRTHSPIMRSMYAFRGKDA
jgi:hypothetical protein